jgi:hypothetical protein
MGIFSPPRRLDDGSPQRHAGCRVGQRRLYQPNADALAMQGLSPSRGEPLRLAANPEAAQTVTPVAAASAAQQEVAQNDTEVICIVRSRGNPQAPERVYILEQPSSDLLDRLARESRGALAASQIATRNAPPVTPNPNPIRATAPGEPVVRAQSADHR